jgi:hypothetical protein
MARPARVALRRGRERGQAVICYLIPPQRRAFEIIGQLDLVGLVELRDDVNDTMKKPWCDGTLALVFEPEDLLARLCAMVPPPHWHSSGFMAFARRTHLFARK